MLFGRRIERTAAGDYRVRLTRAERAILRGLPGELRALLEADPRHPDVRRLFPPAYEDADDDAEYRRLVGDELSAGHDEALRVLEETLHRDRLAPGEAEAWLRALTVLRLALGSRLGVTEETFDRGLDPRHPRARELATYAYLSWLQEQLVDAVSTGLHG